MSIEISELFLLPTTLNDTSKRHYKHFNIMLIMVIL